MTTDLKLVSKSVVLDSYKDEGIPGPENFSFQTNTVDSASMKDGDIMIQVLSMSADPYLRYIIKTTGSVKVGKVINGFVSGKVLRSHNPEWKEGDLFGANLEFTTVQIISNSVVATLRKLTGLIEDESQISLGVGIMGMTGSTAYGGLLDILKPLSGETIFVSAASGAVGGLVGMMAKNLFGCTVIGSCGGPLKCALIKEKYGFDHAIDYKTISDTAGMIAALKEVAPDGIDMYFENVGGMHFEAAFSSLRTNGRIAVCGEIANYNSKTPILSPISLMSMIYTQQRIEGFTCFPWLSGQKGNFSSDMSKWIKEGKIILPEEHFFEGIEQWPAAFVSLFKGENIGKVVVRI